jgi:hypothetical protein
MHEKVWRLTKGSPIDSLVLFPTTFVRCLNRCPLCAGIGLRTAPGAAYGGDEDVGVPPGAKAYTSRRVVLDGMQKMANPKTNDQSGDAISRSPVKSWAIGVLRVVYGLWGWLVIRGLVFGRAVLAVGMHDPPLSEVVSHGVVEVAVGAADLNAVSHLT